MTRVTLRECEMCLKIIWIYFIVINTVTELSIIVSMQVARSMVLSN